MDLLLFPFSLLWALALDNIDPKSSFFALFLQERERREKVSE